ncbi:AEL320Wp [Eremothecium gossypii ATCC 10895]|uniref:AEL320Wp n=1 Tax=Eremothecium gossypii (strain ATCC 10895 / CBS 109.51 / FGSC 9923 / NRRL Y-1056) TaxID=284811 RepID=Q758V6_EREGS|nr:AEL320Wp [Eremothecium gossypii ATCC 10895]AAS52364.1 AEL320Wp [Eremothecium gossypii ATCC 10895]
MSTQLDPTEEHYLKRELLRLELNTEFGQFNDAEALRMFGAPFSADAPRKHGGGGLKGSLPLSLKRRLGGKSGGHETAHVADTEFPLLRHFLHTVVMTCPLLSQDLAASSHFWQSKVQAFFEHFMSMPFSSSYDREELTKRRKLAIKMSKLVLLFYNSGVGARQEQQYYAALEPLNLPTGDMQGGLGQFIMPTRESIQYAITQEPVYFNGIDINVIAVVDEECLLGDSLAHASSQQSWIKSAFNIPSRMLSRLAEAGMPRRKVFLIKVQREGSQGEFQYVARHYDDLKHLYASLRKEFPGKKIPALIEENRIPICISKQPFDTKFKSAGSGNQTDVDCILGADPLDQQPSPPSVSSLYRGYENSRGSVSNGDADEQTTSSDASSTSYIILEMEAMRTALRQYLRAICQDAEVSASLSLTKFLFKRTIDKRAFTPEILEDIESRELMDVYNLENQVKFQKMAFDRTVKLQSSLKSLKDTILQDNDYIMRLFREFKEKEDPSDLSEPLRDFFEWCKIYISATTYQVFLGNDNCYDFYYHVRRLHKLMPYTVMSKIMKYTNPMSIMKTMMDLFMARPFGGQSLLQTIFSNILSDDLKVQEKMIEDLEMYVTSETIHGSEVARVLQKCIFDNEQGEYIDMDAVYEFAKAKDLPLVLVILMQCHKTKLLSSTALEEVKNSFKYWKTMKSMELSMVSTNSSITDCPGLYFSHIKELLHIYIKERDIRVMKLLWQESELPALLKSIVSLFYEPLVKLFKVARVDVAMANFEKFMDELISLLDDVITGKHGLATRVNVVEKIHGLVDKHEDIFYKFIHEIYVNDTENIFEGLITWISDVSAFLQNSKWGEVSERVDLMALLHAHSDIVDVPTLRKQLADMVDQKRKAQEIYSKIVNLKAATADSKGDGSLQQRIDDGWKQMNNAVLPQDAINFGIDDRDLVDLDIDVGDFDYLHNEEQELQDEYRTILNKQVDTSEIERFNKLVFRNTLKELLNV